MAVSFVSYSTVYDNANWPVLPAPAGAVAGNLIVAYCAALGYSATLSSTSGWTIVTSNSDASGTYFLAWHIYSAGETSYTFLFSGSGGTNTILGACYAGTQPTNPVDVGACGLMATGVYSGSAFTTPSVTTTKGGDFVASLWQEVNASANVATALVPQSPEVADVTSVYSAGNGMDAIGHVTQSASGASPAQTAIVTAGGGGGPNSGICATLALFSYSTPLAPTLNSPANSSYAPLAGTPTFVWTYNNTDGTTQQDWAFRMKISGAGSYSYWNLGSLAWQGTIVWNAGGSGSYTFPSASFANGNTYNWSVATESTASLLGPFATDFVVVARAAPTVTVTGPTGASTSTNPVVTWTETLAGGASQIAYQVRTFSAAQYGAGGFSAGTSTATDDSGLVSGAALTYTIATALPGGTWESYVQITETGPEVSAWTNYTSFTTVVDEPATPTITATASTDGATGCPVVSLVVAGGNNLLSQVDASFETGIGTFAGTNATLTQSATMYLDGAYSLRSSATTTGGVSAASGYYAVLPNTAYSALVSSIAAATSRTTSVGIHWYTSAHASISTSSGSGVANNTSTWTQATAAATSPATAAFATIVVATTASASSELQYWDDVGLFVGTTSIWSRGGILGYDYVAILRSDGLYVRNASLTNPYDLNNTTDTGTVEDFEVVPGTAYTYTAVVVANLGGGSYLTSPASSATGAAMLYTTGWWFLNPLVPSGAISPAVLSPVISQTEQSAAHYPIGSGTGITYPTVVSSGFNGQDGTAAIQTFTAADYAAVVALLIGGQTVFISSPFGVVYYVHFGPQPGGMSSGTGNKARVAALLASTLTAPVQSIAVSWVAQSRPAV
jgi:hypothetical protein